MTARTAAIPYDRIRALEWRDGGLQLLDQRLLPHETRYLVLTTLDEVAQAIRDMAVRGAPAIGIAAAYAVVLGAMAYGLGDPKEGTLAAAMERLRQARPTAVNLGWAVDRMRSCILQLAPEQDPAAALLQEAQAIHSEDIAGNHRLGAFGAKLLPPDAVVLTHCNTGALATGGYGTALGVIRAAAGQGQLQTVYAGETRPWLQGARLTTWELLQEGIPVTLITDSAAAHLMKSRRLDWVIVGADRVAANGDVANKIGTYGLALLARAHGVRFMVAAPISTFDLQTPTGASMVIEDRSQDEVLCFQGHRHSAAHSAWNPAFDVTPAALIDALVSERGVIEAPTEDKIRQHLAG